MRVRFLPSPGFLSVCLFYEEIYFLRLKKKYSVSAIFYEPKAAFGRRKRNPRPHFRIWPCHFKKNLVYSMLTDAGGSPRPPCSPMVRPQHAPPASPWLSTCMLSTKRRRRRPSGGHGGDSGLSLGFSRCRPRACAEGFAVLLNVRCSFFFFFFSFPFLKPVSFFMSSVCVGTKGHLFRTV